MLASWKPAVLLVALAAALAAQSGTVEGDVIDSATNRPIAGARVKLLNSHSTLYTKTDAGGHFQFQQVAFGFQSIMAERPGYMGISEELGMRGPTGRASLSRNQPGAQLHIALRPYGVISGKISDAAGVPVEGANVELLKLCPVDPKNAVPWARRAILGDQEIASVHSVRTNDRGEYRLARLAPGTYFVDVQGGIRMGPSDSAERTTYYPRALHAESAKAIPIGAGTAAENIDIQVIRQTGVRVSGRVIQPAGTPPARIMVNTNVVLWRPEAPQDAMSPPQAFATNNRFELKDVLPGKYVMEANTSDNTDFGNPRTLLAAKTTIEVGDKDVEGVEIVMQPPVDLQGTVTFPENCPAIPVSIWPTTISRLGPMRSQVFAKDGVFTLRGLIPGKYMLTVNPPPVSILLGDREVTTDGFELTGANPGKMKITMTCGKAGVAR